jgi:sarcosine oxidase subunit gamma
MVKITDRIPPPQRGTDWLRPLPVATRFVLHANAAARAAAAIAWQVPFAEEACRAYAQGSRATLWLGPDEYLLLAAANEAAEPLAAALERALDGLPHALVDVSHRQTAFEIYGPHCEHLLSGGCPLDLDLTRFPVGMCTRTIFGKADIVLWRTEPKTFHVEVWRSFNEYLAGVLAEVARDYYSGT